MTRDVEITTRSERIDIIREELRTMQRRRRGLEEELSQLVMSELGLAPGAVLEVGDTGLHYAIERGSVSLTTDAPTLMCRRFYKSGRRAGRMARSITFITYGPNISVIGTLQSGKFVAYSSEK